MHQPATATSIRCPVCSQSDWSVAMRRVGLRQRRALRLRALRRLRAARHEPMPADDVIERYYSTKYRGDRHAFTDRMRVKLRAACPTPTFRPGFRGRLLDIGCGDGHFAMHMRDADGRFP